MKIYITRLCTIGYDITLDYNTRGQEFESWHNCCHVCDIILPFTVAFSKASWCKGELKYKIKVDWWLSESSPEIGTWTNVGDHVRSSLKTGTPTCVSDHVRFSLGTRTPMGVSDHVRSSPWNLKNNGQRSANGFTKWSIMPMALSTATKPDLKRKVMRRHMGSIMKKPLPWWQRWRPFKP